MARLWCGAGSASGYARCLLGPKFINRYKKGKIQWEHVEKNPQTRSRRSAGQKRERWNVEGKREEESGVGGFMAQKGLWDVAKKRMLEDRGALPKDEGELISVVG